MGKMYTAATAESAQTAAVDLFELTAPSTRIVYIHAIEIAQNTEVGDSAEESLALLFKRGSSGSTSGSGGSSVTPAPVDANAGSAGSTVEMMNTTAAVAGGGTLTTLVATAFNVRSSPVQWIFTPEMRPVVSPSERFIIGLGDTPADSITWSVTVWFEEVG